MFDDEETFLRDPAATIDQPPGYVTEDDDDEDASAPVEDQEEEMMDPGSLLIVAATIEALCQGVAVDPQSGTFI